MSEQLEISSWLDDLKPENKDTNRRYTSFQKLRDFARENPAALYKHWDYLVSLLHCQHSYARADAMHLITAVLPADTEGRFDGIFDDYFGLLNDDTIPVAAHVAINSGQVVSAKPHLEERVTARLLAIDSTHFPPERRDLIKAGAVQSFDSYFESARDKEAIVVFVRDMAEHSLSPKTKKLAVQFLKKRGLS